MIEPAREILRSGALQLGVSLDDRQVGLFDRFTELLLEWNEKFNLTGITEPEEIAVKHHLDSLSLLCVTTPAQKCTLIDIGTGAGFPGIPLKIARPDLRLTLLDSVRKKLTFLETAINELHLDDVELVHARAEDLGRQPGYREYFDMAVSRAVSRLNTLAELCMPFCRVGGEFVAYKGPDIRDELSEASKAIHILGGDEPSARSINLPPDGLRRTLVVVRKSRPTPRAYPRKAGIPERQPIK